MKQDRWTIGETRSSGKASTQTNGPVPAPAPRRRGVLRLVLVGVFLAGGFAFFLKPLLMARRPPRPAVAAPVLSHVDPQTPTVRILEGEKVTFTTQAEGVDPLRYEWIFEGQSVSQAQSWTYNPKLGDRSDTPKDLKVQIVDRQGQAVERHWQVFVTYISLPPQLNAFAPKKGTVEVISGRPQSFRIDVTDPDRETLTYAWTVNGGAVGAKAALNWAAPNPGSYQVRAVATDRAGLTVSKDWQVVAVAPPPLPIPNDPTGGPPGSPRITKYTPGDVRVTIQEGETLTFSTTASDPNGEPLTYAWAVDGKSITGGATPNKSTFTWRAKSTGNHTIQAIIRNERSEFAAIREWRMTVEVPQSVSSDTSATSSETPSRTSNSPPRFTSRSPSVGALKTSAGQSLAFEATAMDPDGDELSYEWLVDGSRAGRGKAFSFSASEAGQHRLEVRAADAGRLRTTTKWEIDVSPAPLIPRIVMFTPHARRYVMSPRLSRLFSVEIEVPGATDAKLVYDWKLNGRTVSQDTSFEFKDQPVGSYELAVTVFTVSGGRASQQWTVEVRPDENPRSANGAPPLEVSDLSNTTSEDQKTVTVTGKLRNTDRDRTADNVLVSVTAVTADGKEVVRRITLPSPQPIEPGQTASFHVELPNLPEAADFRVQVVNK